MPSSKKDAKAGSSRPAGSMFDPAAVAETFTPYMVVPFALVAAYMVVLRGWMSSMEIEHKVGPDPFENVWISCPIIATIVYLLFVHFGCKWMENRKPFSCKEFMFTYNVYQVVLNTWTVIEFVRELSGRNMPWWGNRIDRSPAGYRLGFLIWCHYNNKYLELLDTVFMVLRKKNRQISFLHMYHHVLLIWAWYLVCRVECGGDCYFGAMINSFVHIVMYSYYMFASLGFNCFWKRYITQVQMTQFCICMAHSAYAFMNGNAPVILSAAQAYVMLNMLVLFGNFYIKNYKSKGKKAA